MMPASFVQEAMWFVDRAAAGPVRNHVPLLIRMRGRLDAEVLGRSLTAVVARQPVLRTTLVEVDGQVLQRVHSAAAVELARTDLSACSDDQRDAEFAALVGADVRAALPMHEFPWRARLIRLTPTDHVLVFVAHHVAWDPRSTRVFLTDLTASYATGGRAPALADPATSYVDFAAWQRQTYAPANRGELAAYWRRALAGAEATEVPTDRPRGLACPNDGGALELRLRPEVLAGLARLADAHDTTLFAPLLTGFLAVLSRWTGRDDLLVATAAADRPHRDLADLIGCFVNPLPLRVPLDGALTMGDVLERARSTLIEAFAHTLPFPLIVDAVAPARDVTRQPLSQIEFTYLGRFDPLVASVPGLDFTVEQRFDESAQFDLGIVAGEIDGELSLSLAYRRALYDEPTVAALLDHVGLAVKQLATDPATPLAELAPPPPRSVIDVSAVAAQSTESDGPPQLQAAIAADIIAPLLGLDQVDEHADFFALGGNSLQALTVVARVRALFGVEIGLMPFLLEPTVAGLSGLVAAELHAPASAG